MLIGNAAATETGLDTALNLSPLDPLAYAMVDGKLYLNFNQEVKAKWDKDRAGFIAAAEKNWVAMPDDAKFGE